jgi:hypothetical protein
METGIRPPLRLLNMFPYIFSASLRVKYIILFTFLTTQTTEKKNTLKSTFVTLHDTRLGDRGPEFDFRLTVGLEYTRYTYENYE